MHGLLRTVSLSFIVVRGEFCIIYSVTFAFCYCDAAFKLFLLYYVIKCYKKNKGDLTFQCWSQHEIKCVFLHIPGVIVNDSMVHITAENKISKYLLFHQNVITRSTSFLSFWHHQSLLYFNHLSYRDTVHHFFLLNILNTQLNGSRVVFRVDLKCKRCGSVASQNSFPSDVSSSGLTNSVSLSQTMEW